jgi:hypothetical protein
MVQKELRDRVPVPVSLPCSHVAFAGQDCCTHGTVPQGSLRSLQALTQPSFPDGEQVLAGQAVWFIEQFDAVAVQVRIFVHVLPLAASQTSMPLVLVLP